MLDKKDNKCLHCAFIDAPCLCENCSCDDGLLAKDEERIRMENWNEIYGEKNK